MSSKSESPVLRAALACVRGDSPLRIPVSVFPVCRPVAGGPRGCNAPWHADAARYPQHKAGKTPVVAWAAYQKRLATEAEWRAWDQRFRGRYNLGLATGRVSGVLALDVDTPQHAEDGRGPDGRASLHAAGIDVPDTPAIRTGSGGLLALFAYPDDAPTTGLRNFAGRWPGVDARGDGGYVVVPPSDGRQGPYRWEAANVGLPLAPCPDWLLSAFDDPDARPDGQATEGLEHGGWAELWMAPCPAGRRNATTTRLAGHLAAHGLDDQEAVGVLLAWNAVRCTPPLDEGEVTTTVASVFRTHGRHDPTLGIAPVSEAEATAGFESLPDAIARALAGDDPAMRCVGAAKALAAGLAPGCVLRCLMAMNGGDVGDARRALRWAMRRAEGEGHVG